MTLDSSHSEWSDRIGFTRLSPGEWDELSQERRILLAYVKCLGRWGMAKTTMNDVAREAGCGRATVYRMFPGGTEALYDSARLDQVAELMTLVAASVDVTAPTIELAIDAAHCAACEMAANETLTYLLRHEPEALEPHVALDSLDGIIGACSASFVPLLSDRLGVEGAARLVEHLARVVMSYVQAPSQQWDLTHRPDVERLLRGLVLPGHLGLDATATHQSTEIR